jgi:Ca2+/H+ antiporter
LTWPASKNCTDIEIDWLEGLLLMVLYIIIAVAAFVSPNPEAGDE